MLLLTYSRTPENSFCFSNRILILIWCLKTFKRLRWGKRIVGESFLSRCSNHDSHDSAYYQRNSVLLFGQRRNHIATYRTSFQVKEFSIQSTNHEACTTFVRLGIERRCVPQLLHSWCHLSKIRKSHHVMYVSVLGKYDETYDVVNIHSVIFSKFLIDERNKCRDKLKWSVCLKWTQTGLFLDQLERHTGEGALKADKTQWVHVLTTHLGLGDLPLWTDADNGNDVFQYPRPSFLLLENQMWIILHWPSVQLKELRSSEPFHEPNHKSNDFSQLISPLKRLYVIQLRSLINKIS